MIKNELKNLQIKHNQLITFEGRIKNFDELKYLTNKVLDNFKAK